MNNNPNPNPETATNTPKKESKKILVDIGTSLGHIVIEMEAGKAPKTVSHMLKLFNSGHYLGAGLFRVGAGHVVQIGDMDCELIYRVPPIMQLDLETEHARNTKGTVALNYSHEPGSPQSTFFFNMSNNYHLNPSRAGVPNTTGYPTFGKVIEGMEILESMVKTKKCPSLDLSGSPSEEDAKKYPVAVTSIVVAN
jgi:cyclophilin family peptidyl-prolyl cis-trans isomerase